MRSKRERKGIFGDFGGAGQSRRKSSVKAALAMRRHPGGKRCKAVTSHLDIAPTLVSMTNAAADKKAAIVKDLPGRDFSSLLTAPEQAGESAIRDGMLFCNNMFAYIDGDFLQKAVEYLKQPDGKGQLKAAFQSGRMRPDLRKRGAIRSVFDGRYPTPRIHPSTSATARSAGVREGVSNPCKEPSRSVWRSQAVTA
jgi:arylsulfatase